jgi:hypothetical protein
MITHEADAPATKIHEMFRSCVAGLVIIYADQIGAIALGSLGVSPIQQYDRSSSLFKRR